MTRGIGLCVVAGGAAFAVVQPDPLRLVGLATVRWPASGAHRRVLATARRRLGLPRWCEVVVVCSDDSPTVGPGLLASAGLVLLRVVDPAQVESTVDVDVPEPLQPGAAGPIARLAIGAALAALAPAAAMLAPAVLTTAAPSAVLDIDDGEWQAVGWAVQPISG